ncbi:MAG: glycoside hydrolase family 127 protein [Fimbriimonadaceae bacterium]|nr:glycoside hydrolase family 127 protein [Fimbriimonadaceae bacterium]
MLDPRADPVREAADLSMERRLKRFVVDADSDPARLFARRSRSATAGDWYGEHLGKWLSAASLAAGRTGDAGLARTVGDIVGFLAKEQDPDGYLGTYSEDNPARFDRDTAEGVRTWDLWNVATLLGGLLDASETCQEAAAVADRLGAKIVASFPPGRSVLAQGNHQGLSAAALLWPFARWVAQEPSARNRAFLSRLAGEFDEEPRGLISGPREGRDASKLGTGKAYQLCLAYRGLGEASIVLDRPEWREAAVRFWKNVRERHLTPWGGPWGGVASHLEVFNDGGFFSPYGLVETCSTMAWMDLSHALFEATDEAVYADEWERSAFNALLGARHANGEDWAYFSPANGPRTHTYEWACCKSSGALALERFVGRRSSATTTELSLAVPHAGRFECEGAVVDVATTYPNPGWLTVTVNRPSPTRLTVRFRANAGVAKVNGFVQNGAWWVCDRLGSGPEAATVELAMPLEIVRAQHRVIHHECEVLRLDYLALRQGPVCFAYEPLDGFAREATVRMPTLFDASRFRASNDGTGYDLDAPGHAPIRFVPYAKAGRERADGWRNTWLPVVWQ